MAIDSFVDAAALDCFFSFNAAEEIP
jgi:hypothetical protein